MAVRKTIKHRLQLHTDAFYQLAVQAGKGMKRRLAEDNVNHPQHYTQGSIECIDAIAEAVKDLKGVAATDTGNVIKYMWRWQHKGGTEDLKKARWYLDHLISKMEDN